MRKYLLMFVLIAFTFPTVANGAIVSGGEVYVLPQENYGGNSYQQNRYNNQVRETNRELQRQHDQQRIYNQNQEILNKLNQQEQWRKQQEWNKFNK